jgi:hypothetical protein
LAGIRSRHPELSHRDAVAQLVAEDHGASTLGRMQRI